MQQPSFRPAKVLDILLNRDNPRHVSKDSQEEAIEYLLRGEEVYNLARHMAQHGINPLEVVAVFRDDDGNLVVAEGNRRLCAAQLLMDPEKAPEGDRGRFRALSAKSVDVSEVNVAVFDDYATAKPWLQVLHDGEQDGVGRRRWKPEQKARATTSKSTDALSVALLDYAEAQGLLTADDRPKIRISTVTRYLANPEVRAAMGLASAATSDTIELLDGDVERFHKATLDFFEQIRLGALHSRSTSSGWLAYAAELEGKLGTVSPKPGAAKVVTPAATSAAATPSRKGAKARIMTPDVSMIPRSSVVTDGLNQLGSPKLLGLYKSLTSLRLEDHPALLTTGAWAFFEVLTAIHGRKDGNEFVAYLNSIYSKWGISKEAWKHRRICLEHIRDQGNAEKHGPTFTALDARNLHNRFEVLEPVIAVLLSDCNAAKGVKP